MIRVRTGKKDKGFRKKKNRKRDHATNSGRWQWLFNNGK
uniref:Uncharacterized protein n=1 Tax=uncultured Desulfobacterium sp. TaxID=201089 RepID=E1YKZ0_9BACT|nr:unknown protein [uncultured Desulfobacterium sp.]